MFRPTWRLKSVMIFSTLLLMTLIHYCGARSADSGKGPPILQPTVITARPGSSPILPCRILSSRTKWTKDGAVVGHRRRGKFRRRGSSLRIKKVLPEDAGEYRCASSRNAANARIILLRVEEGTTERAPIAARPRFYKPIQMRERTLTKPEGSFVRLRCKASGYPKPRILWYKDNNLTRTAKSRNLKKWTFEIGKVTHEDSGVYTCKVWNEHGEISYNYTLEVINVIATKNRPVLVKPHPQNTTVHVGGMATFQCQVKSDITPTVNWVKRVDRSTILSYGDDLPGRLLNVESNRYLILPTKDMVTMPDSTYLNKLVIRHATEQDAGMYICLAINSVGYNFRYAYLTVTPNHSQRTTRSWGNDNINSDIREIEKVDFFGVQTKNTGSGTTSLPLIIGIPAGVGLLLVVAMTVYCHRQRDNKFKAQTSTCSSGTKSTRSTPMSELENDGSDPKLNKNIETRPGTYPGMPSAVIPLLKDDLRSTDSGEVQSVLGLNNPPCPPPSAMSASSTNISEHANFLPPAPPPSQHSVMSSSHAYPPPHYHYNSTRRYHHYHHHKHRPQHDHVC